MLLAYLLSPAFLGGAFALTSPTPMPSATAWASPAVVAGSEPSRVEIATADRQVLVGSFFEPKKSRDAWPGALLIHDTGGDRSELSDMAQRLQRSGFAVLTVDLRGHGESATQDMDWSKLDGEGRARLWAFTSRDVRAAADFLLSQANVHSTSLTILGFGSSCEVATRHAAADENVRGLVLLSPVLQQPADDVVAFVLGIRELGELGGLPTYLAVDRGEQPTAKRLVDAVQRGGPEFIEIAVAKGRGRELLEDSNLRGRVTSWMKEYATPKKGR